jgi:multidrug transporter EmrE-like cation transporter
MISPAGAGLVAICFFLPWLKVSCGSKDVTLSGSGIGGAFWFILGLVVVALIAYFMFREKIRTMHLRSILLTCALGSAGIIVYKYFAVVNDPDIPFYVPSSMIKFELRPGSIGVFLGLLMLSAGALLVGDKKGKKPADREISKGDSDTR